MGERRKETQRTPEPRAALDGPAGGLAKEAGQRTGMTVKSDQKDIIFKDDFIAGGGRSGFRNGIGFFGECTDGRHAGQFIESPTRLQSARSKVFLRAPEAAVAGLGKECLLAGGQRLSICPQRRKRSTARQARMLRALVSTRTLHGGVNQYESTDFQ